MPILDIDNKTHWPALAVELPASAQDIRRRARAVASAEIAPHVQAIEQTGRIPSDLWPKLGEVGLLGITVAPAYGGLGLGYLEHLVAMEEISRVSAAVGLSYLVHSHACVNQIHLNGSDEQKRRFLPPLVSGHAVGGLAMTEADSGSDVLNMRTRVERREGGYRLNGRKAWISNAPVADVMVVYACSEPSPERPRLTTFVLERSLPGYHADPPRETLGLHGCAIGDIVLEDCLATEAHRLGPWNGGTQVLMSGLALERLVASGGPLGLMQACADIAVSQARTRRQFGQPIGAFQLMQGKLADMVTTLNAGRAYAYAVGAAMARGTAHRFDSAGLLLFVGERASWLASEALQTFGASGYDAASEAARLLRDAKFFSIGFGTNEIRRIVIGRDFLRGHEIDMNCY
ncbi:MAG: acyl-CoA dehydrogenase family protein [Rhodopila sp.]|jgi:isovaleryl-CoA dehydrogenase